jgi:predicted 2-oxoglutarate/Fe(II)-dependent dioxygenase YbiX
MAGLAVGDRAPSVTGAGSGGRFYAEDVQIGRPAMLVTLGALDAASAQTQLARLERVRRRLAPAIDLLALVPADPGYAHPLAVHVSEPEAVARAEIDGAPALIVVDPNWRIVHLHPFDATTDLPALFEALRPRLTLEASVTIGAAAPVLVLPNVIPPDVCRALIEHFEVSAHLPGQIASATAGAAIAKYDEGKKHRRDFELPPGEPLHRALMKVLAERCAPEIKRAFQFDVAFADRILLARYDDTGGFFKRHRDNLAPQVAFRDFAVSMNLNTDDYDGGELSFPEFGAHRYRPPAGSAAIFSASLLHEVAPVTRGRRYVALSFLSGAASQARMSHAA